MKKGKRRRNFLSQIHLSFDHTRKTTKVINGTNYPLSMAFIFFFCAAHSDGMADLLNFTGQFQTR